MSEVKLDATDKKILNILQENGRLSNNELARRIGLTATPTLERVRRLERDGIIKGYRTIVDEEKIGKGLTVFVSISLAIHKLQAVEEFCDEVDKLPEVLASYHTTGEADFLLKVVVHDTTDYVHLMWQKLTRLPGVQRIHSMVVLSTRKDETKLPIDQGDES